MNTIEEYLIFTGPISKHQLSKLCLDYLIQIVAFVSTQQISAFQKLP